MAKLGGRIMLARLWHWQVLEEAQERLQKVVRERLEEARGRRDHATILRFTRLFPLLGMPVRPCCLCIHVLHSLDQHYMTLNEFACLAADSGQAAYSKPGGLAVTIGGCDRHG